MRVEDASPLVFSVAELTSRVQMTLEINFPDIHVSGEISNLACPQSGHCYFTLKDDRAQIKAVLWRSAASRLKFPLEDGLHVICQGGIEVYPPRGAYQLIVQRVTEIGVGRLELALRKLREKLAAEGLFDPARKRRLPKFPRRIAFVTSPTGAAIHDFLEVLARRWPGVRVYVIPARVQGEGAAAEIAAGIALANRLTPPLDCLVVGRGGGSIEDLWAFNEEPVVRAIYASRVPVISAVGHEIDVTLADLVADVRALTPSEAAERVAPATEEISESLASQGKRLAAALRGKAVAARARLLAIERRRAIRRPFDSIHALAQRLDELGVRSEKAVLRARESARRAVQEYASRLESLSPLGVLARGYSLTEHAITGQVVRTASDLTIGERITTRLRQGRIVSRVEEIEHGE